MANDTREDHGQYYPGGSGTAGGGGSSPEMSGKVDRVNLGNVSEDYSMDDLRTKVNAIVNALKPAVTVVLAACLALGAYGQSARLGGLKANSLVVTNEQDAAGIAYATSATGAVYTAAVAAAGANAQAAIAAGGFATTGQVGSVESGLKVEIASATNALAQTIPPAPDLSSYAQKSWVEGKGYLTGVTLSNYATRAWVDAKGYLVASNIYGYATEAWVTGKGYSTTVQLETVRGDLERGTANATNAVLVTAKGYADAQDAGVKEWVQGIGYATTGDVAQVAGTIDGKISSATNSALEEAKEYADQKAWEQQKRSGSGTYELWTRDQLNYQDGTGIVWHVSLVTPSVIDSIVTNYVIIGTVTNIVVTTNWTAEVTATNVVNKVAYTNTIAEEIGKLGDDRYLKRSITSETTVSQDSSIGFTWLLDGDESQTVFGTGWSFDEDPVTHEATAEFPLFEIGWGAAFYADYAQKVRLPWPTNTYVRIASEGEETDYQTLEAYVESKAGGGSGAPNYAAVSNAAMSAVQTVNGVSGTSVTLDAAAVGARPSTWTPSASDVGAATPADVVAATNAITAASIGALPTTGGTVSGVLTVEYEDPSWQSTGVINVGSGGNVGAVVNVRGNGEQITLRSGGWGEQAQITLGDRVVATSNDVESIVASHPRLVALTGDVVTATNLPEAVGAETRLPTTAFVSTAIDGVSATIGYTNAVLPAASASTLALDRSVQYVELSGTGALTIAAPARTFNAARDFVVYVNTTGTNALNLAALNGVLAVDEAYTNAVEPGVTMMMFTEITNGVWAIGRQALKPLK